MSDIKLFKLNVGYKFYNVFNELILFVDSVEAPITRDISTIDMIKIVPALILYKKELIISCYIEDNTYYSLVKD